MLHISFLPLYHLLYWIIHNKQDITTNCTPWTEKRSTLLHTTPLTALCFNDSDMNKKSHAKHAEAETPQHNVWVVVCSRDIVAIPLSWIAVFQIGIYLIKDKTHRHLIFIQLRLHIPFLYKEKLRNLRQRMPFCSRYPIGWHNFYLPWYISS